MPSNGSGPNLPDTLSGFLLSPMTGIDGDLLPDGRTCVNVTRPLIQYERGNITQIKGHWSGCNSDIRSLVIP